MPARRTRRTRRTRTPKSTQKLLRILTKVQSRKRLTRPELLFLARAKRSGRLNGLKGSGLFDSIGSVLSKVVSGLGSTLGSIIPI